MYTQRKAPIYIQSDTLKLVYVVMTNTGSSTAHLCLNSTRATCMPDKGYTWFTIVSDPLEQAASAFSERGVKYKDAGQELEDFAAFVAALEKGPVRGRYHGQSSVALPADRPYDYVGTVPRFREDWARLGEIQRQRFGIEEWPPFPEPQRAQNGEHPSPLNATSLSAELSQRICRVYRDDYCCFHFPVPPACHIDCQAEQAETEASRSRQRLATTGWLDGPERARSWRQCSMTYHTNRKAPIYIQNDKLKVVYVLMSKSGSSTARTCLHNDHATREPDKSYTWFTVVRDPVERAVSAFFERGAAFKTASRELEDFTAFVAKQEKGTAGHSHGQSSVPLPEDRPYDFVGTVPHFREDWECLGEIQWKRFGIEGWPRFPKPQRVHSAAYSSVLNTTSLSAELSQRICRLYRDDYCCFRLPVPPACHIDCEAE